MNLALLMATSEPEPMAIPTSDIVKAGASLMPSPTIATVARWGAFVGLEKILRRKERLRFGAVF